jgi:tetratricopeptide (TPR) repeat protein
VSEHVSGEDLAALAEGRLSPERLCEAALHLMQPCELCLAAVLGPVRTFLPDERAEAELTPEKSAAYDAAIERAFAAALDLDRKLCRRRKLRHRREVDKALAILDANGAEALEKPRKGIGPLARFDALLERSWSLRHEDHQRMIDLAGGAVRVARSLDARKYGVERIMDLQCRARAELGNAYRVAGQLDQAFDCFVHATRLHEDGTKDAALRVRLLNLQASLAADRRQLGLACLVLGYIHSYHLGEGDNHLAGRALIKMGLYTGYLGEHGRALSFLQQGLQLIDEEREPSLVLSAVHNQLCFLVEAGHFDKARKHLFLNRKLLKQVGGRTNEIKLTWLEARIHQGREAFDKAEQGLRKVRDDFQALKQYYDASIASLDLAMVLLSQKRASEARPILLAAVQVFKGLRIGRETTGAIFLLWQVAEKEQESARLLDIVSQVTAFLRQVERDPNARFNPVIR